MTSPLKISLDTRYLSSEAAQPVLITLLIALFATLTLYITLFKSPNDRLSAPPGNVARIVRSRIPYLGETGLYDRRESWLRRHVGQYPYHNDEQATKPLRAKVAGHIVNIFPSGIKASKSFFGNRDLAFTEAYEELFAGISASAHEKTSDEQAQEGKPSEVELAGATPLTRAGKDAYFSKHLKNCLSASRMAEHDVMRKLAEDYQAAINDHILGGDKKAGCIRGSENKAGATGTFNPHTAIFELMFKASMRIVGPTELVEDREELLKTFKAYWDMETNSGYLNTFWSFIPTPGNYRRLQGGVKLYLTVSGLLDRRIKSGKRYDDYMQTMIDLNVPIADITRWVIGALFASIINTSGMTMHALCHAVVNPAVWKKMRSEVESTLAKLSAAKGLEPESMSTHEQLCALTMDEVDEHFPYTYLVLREAMRLNSNDFVLRKVKSKSGNGTQVDGEKLKDGEFAMFLLEGLHRDDSIYKNPDKYDPERWERGEGSGTWECEYHLSLIAGKQRR